MHRLTKSRPLDEQPKLKAANVISGYNENIDSFHTQLNALRSKLEEAEAENKLLKTLNHTLYISEKELIKQHAQKDKFFSILSHDLKGPLHTLRGFLGILKLQASAFTTNELEEFAHTMDQSVGEVLGLLANLLQWSLSQNGNMHYAPTTLILHEQIAETMGLLSQTAKLKDVHLRNSVNTTIKVQADNDMLHFILRNLLSNAIKFSYQEGQVEVKAEITGTQIAIMVLDQGVGMGEEEASSLFASEQHFSRPGTAQEKGTGLGLLLCKEFVKLHQGNISVESKPKVGTSITFTMPNTQA